MNTQLYKLKIGDKVWENLSLETLSDYIMRNQLQQNDMVAAMHSESWVQAGRIPALKPTFIARDAQDVKPEPATPMEKPTTEKQPEQKHPQDVYLLKLKIGEHVWDKLTPETLSDWIRMGRVQETDLVAASNSENWIQAGRVPALKPAFNK